MSDVMSTEAILQYLKIQSAAGYAFSKPEQKVHILFTFTRGDRHFTGLFDSPTIEQLQSVRPHKEEDRINVFAEWVLERGSIALEEVAKKIGCHTYDIHFGITFDTSDPFDAEIKLS